MKKQTQEEAVISMLKCPIPKKKVNIVKLRMVRESTALNGTDRFHNAEEAAEMVRPLLEYSDREMILVMSLDAALTPIAMEIVAAGGVSTCGIDMRDLFKHAIISNAAKIICFHNHPSREPRPSVMDMIITKKIVEAGKLLGIELIDHIILGTYKKFVSFKEDNIKPFGKNEILV